MLDEMELSRMQERIQQLQAEKLHQKDLDRQTRQQHTRLLHERKDMAAKIQGETDRSRHLGLEELTLLPSSVC